MRRPVTLCLWDVFGTPKVNNPAVWVRHSTLNMVNKWPSQHSNTKSNNSRQAPALPLFSKYPFLHHLTSHFWCEARTHNRMHTPSHHHSYSRPWARNISMRTRRPKDCTLLLLHASRLTNVKYSAHYSDDERLDTRALTGWLLTTGHRQLRREYTSIYNVQR